MTTNQRVVNGIHIAIGLDVAASRRFLKAAGYEGEAARARLRMAEHILMIQRLTAPRASLPLQAGAESTHVVECDGFDPGTATKPARARFAIRERPVRVPMTPRDVLLDGRVIAVQPPAKRSKRRVGPGPLAERRIADRIDGYDRDDLGESPDY